jgi:phosphonopyruvate decarboxylase
LAVCGSLGITSFSGVPCSYLRALFFLLEKSPDVHYYAAPREDIALGFASGSYLAGRETAVVLQNSGLGHLVNPLASLCLIYRIPVLLVIGWRGQVPDADAPEHRVMGPASPNLLADLGIHCEVLGQEAVEETVEGMVRTMRRRGEPAAILVPRGVLE